MWRSQAAVRPAVNIAGEFVAVGQGTGSVETVVLRVRRRTMLSSGWLRRWGHLERGSVNDILEKTRLALDDSCTARIAGVEGGRGLQSRTHVGALQGVTTLGLSQRVNCLGTGTLDGVNCLSLNQRVRPSTTEALGLSLSQ